MYWMRIMDPEMMLPHLKAFDKIQFDTLQEIVGLNFDDVDMLQAVLPLGNSGLAGMRSAESHGNAAFIAASKNSENLVRELLRGEPILQTALEGAMISYNSKVSPLARLDAAKLGAMKSIEQKSLSIAIDNFTEARLTNTIKASGDVLSRNLNLDRLLSIKTEASKAWLLAVPNSNLGLSMTNAELRFALQLRLGHVVGEFNCVGGREHAVDRSGLEILKCKRLQKVRHDVIASTITNIARSAGEHPTRENLGLFGDGSQRRPGDIVLPSFNRGETQVLDVRVTSNAQKKFTSSSPNKAGRAADHGAAVKIRDWDAHCEDAYNETGVRPESKFTPLSVDVYGCWTPDAKMIFYELAKKRSDFTGRAPELEYKYTLQQISMALQRENAKILIAHMVRRAVPDAEDEDEADVVIFPEVPGA
jgi:hypothetical protein